MNGFASVDLVFMDGASLHVEIFKKEKWYDKDPQPALVCWLIITDAFSLLVV